ncbi:MAG: BON domain-containing protein [Lautropia sp.]
MHPEYRRGGEGPWHGNAQDARDRRPDSGRRPPAREPGDDYRGYVEHESDGAYGEIGREAMEAGSHEGPLRTGASRRRPGPDPDDDWQQYGDLPRGPAGWPGRFRQTSRGPGRPLRYEGYADYGTPGVASRWREDDATRGARDRWRDDGDRDWWDRTRDEVSSWFGDDEAQRRRRADHREDHRGRGPRGYRRSDARILDDVNDRLTDDPLLDASDIEVSVSNAEVTLGGSVVARHAKRRAEDIAESVSGVTHVQNNLRVAGTSAGARRSEGVAPSGGTGGGPIS